MLLFPKSHAVLAVLPYVLTNTPPSPSLPVTKRSHLSFIAQQATISHIRLIVPKPLHCAIATRAHTRSICRSNRCVSVFQRSEKRREQIALSRHPASPPSPMSYTAAQSNNPLAPPPPPPHSPTQPSSSSPLQSQGSPVAAHTGTQLMQLSSC